ncbi:hypothetical protein ALI22I_23560 [Saccharothrix sp. ALI-22-I]|uniref:hypothetical protein n=1 Tax=Saccharothrix sp. ALI-22-I TaxID=1933778 RepID=UPI00097CBD62|nr:hypothetical protein [Saccharothrix sp. ALI-22-I]ONI86622.1 hypothetical protein ALI22I_23560 [Saccharothrix sp. ALI-22-I]
MDADDDKPLRAAVSAAFGEPDIAWGLTKSSLTQPDLRSLVFAESASISAVASVQESAHAELEAMHRSPLRRLSIGTGRLLTRVARGTGRVLDLVIFYGPLLLFAYQELGSWFESALVVLYVAAFPLSAQLRARLGGPRSRGVVLLNPDFYDVLVFLAAMAASVALVLRHVVPDPRVQEFVSEAIGASRGSTAVTVVVLVALVVAWVILETVPTKGVSAVGGFLVNVGEQGVGRVRRRYRLIRMSVRKEWEQVLLTDGVLPFLRKRLNDELGPRFETVLDVEESPGLRISHDRAVHVQTRTGQELARIVAARGRGSLALSGPRGSGKTNLMRAFCAGRYREPGRAPDLTLMVSAPVVYEPQEFVLHLYAALCRRVIEYARGRDPRKSPPPAKLMRQRRWLTEFRERSVGMYGATGHRPTRIADLAETAMSRLVAVRSLQTYTGEIAGKAGRSGVELSGRKSIAFATRALTYPEIVDEFSEFLREVAATLRAATEDDDELPGRVIVGIDELDRLGTGERARTFLNEIKAVFGAGGCFFLVSVSEDALYEFDLGSPGLRTVFDSAFDEVVRLENLDLRTACELLGHQIVGLPVQFAALVHVLSGGIPRDLVRYSIAMLDLSGMTLAEVALRLVELDVERVRKSTAHAVGAGNPVLFRALVEPLGTPLASGPLDRYVERLLAVDADDARLRDVLAVNVALLSAVLAVFDDGLDEERMDRAPFFDGLAEVRRVSGLNPVAALDLLNECRRSWGLPPVGGKL